LVRLGFAHFYDGFFAVLLKVIFERFDECFAKFVARSFRTAAADITRYETALSILFWLQRLTQRVHTLKIPFPTSIRKIALCGRLWGATLRLGFERKLLSSTRDAQGWSATAGLGSVRARTHMSVTSASIANIWNHHPSPRPSP
jgi:hypothetical protein